MGAQRLQAAATASDRTVVIRLAIEALEAPEIQAATVRSTLELGTADGELRSDEWLILFASLVFTRPELISSVDVAHVGAILRQDDPDGNTHRIAGEILKALLTTPLARQALDVAIGTLDEPQSPPTSWKAAISCLRRAVLWVPDLLDPRIVIGLAELEHLKPERRHLAEAVIEPLVLRRPCISDALCDRLMRLYEHPQDSKYVLYFLKGKDLLPAAVRTTFSLHDEVSTLREGVRRVLMVHNIRHGVGDEIIRCVPLLQSFLDANPDLEATVVTPRTYLYAHSRIRAVSTSEPAKIERLWQDPFDVVVDFVQPFVPASSGSLLEEAVDAYVRRQAPWLFLWGTNTDNEFVFERVEVASRPVARVLGLDRHRVKNPYETSCRVVAELGLPLHVREKESPFASALAGDRWLHAEALWREITQHNDHRPVALLNPLGGGHPLKGCSDGVSIAKEIRRLLDEGYFVVVLPNGTSWGRSAVVEDACQRLTRGERAHVAIGLDPAEDRGIIPAIPRLSPLSYGDYVMRLVIHWMSYADLVVTVEGWTMHASYCLRKPYRVLMFAYSEPGWCPHAASEHQTVMQPAALSPKTDGLDRMPDWYRKQTLLLLLNEIAKAALNEALRVFRQALQNRDRDIRQAAAVGLVRCLNHEVEHVIALLQDESREVRGVAAQALLDRGFESANVPREHLKAHVLIGRRKLDWRAVIQLGRGVRPVLEIARHGDEPSVRREAAGILRMYDAGLRKRRGGLLSRIWGRRSSSRDRMQDLQ